MPKDTYHWFADVVKALGKEKAKNTLAYAALKQIGAIYKIEEELKELTPEERVYNSKIDA